MRKTLSLLLLLCAFSINAKANAMVANMGKVWHEFKFESNDDSRIPVSNNLIEPGENEVWWGYFDGNVKNVLGLGMGDSAKDGDTYNCAIFIPNDKFTKECVIKALRFYFLSALNVEDLKIWISHELPNNPNDADIEVRDVDKGEITDGAPDGLEASRDPVNDISFKKPYKIEGNGVYVGYSFRISNIMTGAERYPVAVSRVPNIADKYASYLKMNNLEWVDYKGLEFGNIALRVLLEGDFNYNILDVNSDFPTVTCLKNSKVELPVELINKSGKGVDNFSYVATIGGVKGEERQYVPDSKIEGLGTKLKCNLPIEIGNVSGKLSASLEITKVNGSANNTNSNICKGDVIVLSKAAKRKALLEIFTGTECKLAAKGYASAIRAREMYKDDVVISNVHFDAYGRGSDPMEIEDYKGLLPATYPMCDVNREYKDVDPYFYKSDIDDYYGMRELIERVQKELPVATIKAECLINQEGSKVTANSYTTFLYDGDCDNYQVAYVLSANGLTGEGPNWEQLNDFANFKEDPVEWWNYEPVFLDWIAMDYSIKGFEFNDVPVATMGVKDGVKGSVKSPFIAGEVQKHSVEFDLNKIGSRIQDKDKLQLSVYLIDKSTGVVVNADCQKVVNDSFAAIEDANCKKSDVVVKRYSIDGTVLSSPVKGLNIVKYADGRIEKVVL